MAIRTAFATAAVVLAGMASTATAATIGSLTFGDDAYVDTAVLAQGNLSGTNPAGIIGGSFGTNANFYAGLQTNNTPPVDTLQVGFTDNTLGNDAGADLVIWEAFLKEVPQISLTLNGPALDGTFLESLFIPGSTTQQMHAYTFDLTDLGVAPGQQITSLFIAPGTGETDVEVMAAAALNPGQSGGGTPVVPLPAGGVLLLSGLGAVALLRRRERRGA